MILEAQIPEYRWGSRFSVYTGLPTVQGWNWHQRQQRSVVPSVEVERRVDHVQEIYNTSDPLRAQSLIDLYGVRYIIVGGLERAYLCAGGPGEVRRAGSAGVCSNLYIRAAQSRFTRWWATMQARSRWSHRDEPTPEPGIFDSPLE